MGTWLHQVSCKSPGLGVALATLVLTEGQASCPGRRERKRPGWGLRRRGRAEIVPGQWGGGSRAAPRKPSIPTGPGLRVRARWRGLGLERVFRESWGDRSFQRTLWGLWEGFAEIKASFSWLVPTPGFVQSSVVSPSSSTSSHLRGWLFREHVVVAQPAASS